MAHFARIENGIVTQVIVVNNDVLTNDSGKEIEAFGVAFCEETFGGEWVQTSYNAKFRGKYAGIGDTYDPVNDVFVGQASNDAETL